MKRLSVGILLLFVMFGVSQVQGAISAFDKGIWNKAGSHTAGYQNTFTGENKDGATVFRSFFAFDLSGVTLPVVGGDLDLELQNYFGSHASESFIIYDVSTLIATDLLPSGSGRTDIFGDLGSGSSYGSATVSSSDVGSIISIPLSAAAIADINATAGGDFAVGVSLTTIGSIPGSWEGVRFSTIDGAGTHELVLTYGSPGHTPEPTTFIVWGILGAFGIAIGWWRRRRVVRVSSL